MKAGIIAAGEGSRLRAEGTTVPKPLVEVRGMPLIERLIESFLRQGITELACIINEADLQVKYVVEQRRFPVPIHFVVQTTASSMHSLFALEPYLRGGNFLLSTVDSVFHEDEFGRYLQYSRQRRDADGILAVTKYIDDENPLFVELDEAGCIRSFSKADGSPWVTGGLYVLSSRIFDEIENVRRRGIERLRNLLGYLVTCGYTFEGYPFSKIVDVDHVRDIQVAGDLLRR